MTPETPTAVLRWSSTPTTADSGLGSPARFNLPPCPRAVAYGARWSIASAPDQPTNAFWPRQALVRTWRGIARWKSRCGICDFTTITGPSATSPSTPTQFSARPTTAWTRSIARLSSLTEFDPETGASRPGTATLTATGPQTYDPESYLFDYLYLLPYEAPGCVPSQVAVVFNFNSAPMAQFGGWYTLDKVADSRPKWELATTINGFDCRFRLEPTASGVDFTFWVKCGSSPDVWDVLVWIALRADTTPTIGMDNWMTWYAECNYSDYGTSWFRSGIEDCNGTDFRSPWSGNEQVLIGAINDCG